MEHGEDELNPYSEDEEEQTNKKTTQGKAYGIY